MKKILLLFAFNPLFFTLNGTAQNHVLDSLHAVLKTYQEDTNRVNTLNEISWETTNIGNYDLAMQNANEALELGKKLNYDIGQAASYSRRGRIYEGTGNYDQALENYMASLKIKEKIGDKQGIANSNIGIGNINISRGNYPEALKNYSTSLKMNLELGNTPGSIAAYIGVGLVYKDQGNLPEALNSFLSSLRIAEESGNKAAMASAYNNIGTVYDIQNNYAEALKNYFASLKIEEERGNKQGIASAYNNIGLIYYDQGHYEEALKNHLAALKLKQELGSQPGMASSLNNIGGTYAKLGNFPEALKNYEAALKINEEIGNQVGVLESNGSIGLLYLKLKKYKEATTSLTNSLLLAKKLGVKEDIKGIYEGLSKVDSATQNWHGAYLNHKMYLLYRDSLINEEFTKKTVQAEMNYEFDKKEQATRLEQEKKDALTKQEIQKQKIVRNSFMGGFATVLLFSVVVYRQRNKVKKAKKRSDELLLNILPAEVAEELKETGTAKAKSFDMVTVLFTDFKGFTIISEQLSAQDLVAEINYCFSAFDTIVHKYGIEKIKTIGDSYMCAGGLPATNHTHPEDVVKAGIEIRDFMLNHKRERESKGTFAFEIRIGIHTGPVVAGIVGLKKFAYDIWGNTVNLASRMESSGEAGKINISESTYELVKTKFNCEHRGKITVKNTGDVDMYFVENITA
jgi:adenylate cyclase